MLKLFIRASMMLSLICALFSNAGGNCFHPRSILTVLNDISVASGIQVIKLQENQILYSGTSAYNQVLLSTVTGGWTLCHEYSVSLWVKNVGRDPSNWWEYVRLSNDPASA